jgi:hypothetical protein
MKQYAGKYFLTQDKVKVFPVCRENVRENGGINLRRCCMIVSSQLHISAALPQVKFPRCALNRRVSKSLDRSKYQGEVKKLCCSP